MNLFWKMFGLSYVLEDWKKHVNFAGLLDRYSLFSKKSLSFYIKLYPEGNSVTQPWRAASLCPFGGLDLVPSVEALSKNGKNRILQAIELESGIGRQWRLWKWACYSASEVMKIVNLLVCL